MLQRPVYRAALMVLTLGALASGLWLLVAPPSAPGIELVLPTPQEHAAQVGEPEAAVSERLDLNEATAAEMAEALPGIGPVISQRIVDYRVENGPFVRKDQLLGVKGIGAVTYQRLSDLITVGAAPGP